MKHLLTTLLMVSVGTCGSTIADEVSAEQKEALAELVKLTFDVIDELTRPQPNFQPPRVRPAALVPAVRGVEDQPFAAVAVQAPEELLEAKLKAREQRLEAHSAAFADWATRVCDLSKEERTALDESLAQQHVKVQDRWKRNAHRHNTPMSDYAPVSFTTFGGAGSYLSRKRLELLLKSAFTDDHREALLTAFDARLEAVRLAMLDYAIWMIDEELFLSEQQRQRLTDELRGGIDNVEDGVFTFNTRHYYLPYTSLSNAVHVLPDSLLTDVQRERLNDAFENAARGRDNLIFSTGNPESWQQQVDAAAAEIQSMFITAARLRASWLAATLDLSPSQQRQATVAGTGAAVQCTADWKQHVNEQLEHWKVRAEQQFAGRNVRFGMAAPKAEGLDTNELWQHTVSKLGADDAHRMRQEFHRSARVGYLVAMLDKELWLTPEQREPLAALVESTLPQFHRNSDESYRETQLLVIPVASIANDKLAVFLTEAQQTAWKTLRNQFQVNGNFVLIQMQNGGQAQFVLPPNPQAQAR